MPKYFLHLVLAGMVMEDRRGRDLPDDAAARECAIEKAKGVLRSYLTLNSSEIRIDVVGEDGRILFGVPFSEVGDEQAGRAKEMPKLHDIGERAREFGLTPGTLRFYENRRLLKPHRIGTARRYSAEDKARIAAILEGRAIGLTNMEIATALAASDGPDLKLSAKQIENQIAHLERERTEIERAIARLQRRHAPAAPSVDRNASTEGTEVGASEVETSRPASAARAER